jgi:threonine dehydratase
MREGANRDKVGAVKEYCAGAVLHGKVWDDAYEHAPDIAAQRGLVYIHPLRDQHVMAGQSTVALEILEDLPEVEAGSMQ